MPRRCSSYGDSILLLNLIGGIKTNRAGTLYAIMRLCKCRETLTSRLILGLTKLRDLFLIVIDSYFFLLGCQKTLKSYALKSADWFQDNGCHSANDARVSKPHISWEACNLPSSSLTMAFKDPILLKSFEIMGSGRGEFNTVTSFKMEYKFNIQTESINHQVFDWRPYQLNGQDYVSNKIVRLPENGVRRWVALFTSLLQKMTISVRSFSV